METRKLLASLSYFSVFFAPFLAPIIIYFIADDREVKRHAKAALLSHLIPTVLGIVAVIVSIGSFLTSDVTAILSANLIVWGLFAVVYFIAFVYNIVKGIKVLL